MDDYVKWPLAGAFVCATLVALLAILVYGAGTFQHFDLRVFLELSEHQHSRLGEVAESIAFLADPAPLVVFTLGACGLALLRREPLDALAILVAVLGANVTTQVMKALLSHPRAQSLLGGSAPHNVGFPSGHTTAAFSVAVAYGFGVPRHWAPLALLIGGAFGAAVGCSVVIIAWHHPGDAIGGFLVAAAWGLAVLAAVRAAEPPVDGAGFSAPGAQPYR